MTIQDALFSEVQNAVDRNQPELNVSRTDNLIILEGLFVVSGPNGPFDSYQIKAGITAGSPAEEPVVFEEGGRIPRTADRHVFPKDGNCCLGVWEEWLLTASDCRFETFLTGPMHDYFVSQTYYEVNKKWPFGERSHGIAGVVEAFSEILGVKQDRQVVAAYLRLVCRQHLGGHAVCPCDSGRRLRDCHRGEVEALRGKVPRDVARRMLRQVDTSKKFRKVP